MSACRQIDIIERLQNLQSIPTFAIDMHGLAAALIVTLNVLLAASPAAGARAPTHTHSRAGKLFSLASVSQKQNSKKQTPCKDRRLSDDTRMAHLDTMQF